MTLFEALVALGITVGGLGVASGLWRGRPWDVAAVSVPVGGAVYLLVGLALFAGGFYSTSVVVVATVLVGAIVLGLGTVRGTALAPGDAARAATAVAVGVILVLAFSAATALTRLTPDSVDHLSIAGAIEILGEFPDLPNDEIVKRQFGSAALQTAGIGSGVGYVGSIVTLLTASGVAAMARFGYSGAKLAGARRSRAIVPVVAVLALVLTTNRVLYHHFYINGHGAFAAMLVVSIAVVWYATVTRDWIGVVMAGLAASTLGLFRAEGIVVVIVFLLPVLVSASTPLWARMALTLPVAVVSVVWNLIVLPGQASDGASFGSTPTMAAVLSMGLVVGALVASVDRRWIRVAVAAAPAAVLLLLAAYTALRITRGQSLFNETLEAIGANLAYAGLWGVFWWVAPVVLVACLVTVRVPAEKHLLWGLVSYPLILLASAYLRGSAYRVGAGDSANRMLMHVVFVIGLYLIIALGHIASDVDGADWSVAGVRAQLLGLVAVDEASPSGEDQSNSPARSAST